MVAVVDMLQELLLFLQEILFLLLLVEQGFRVLVELETLQEEMVDMEEGEKLVMDGVVLQLTG